MTFSGPNSRSELEKYAASMFPRQYAYAKQVAPRLSRHEFCPKDINGSLTKYRCPLGTQPMNGNDSDNRRVYAYMIEGRSEVVFSLARMSVRLQRPEWPKVVFDKPLGYAFPGKDGFNGTAETTLKTYVRFVFLIAGKLTFFSPSSKELAQFRVICTSMYSHYHAKRKAAPNPVLQKKIPAPARDGASLDHGISDNSSALARQTCSPNKRKRSNSRTEEQDNETELSEKPCVRREALSISEVLCRTQQEETSQVVRAANTGFQEMTSRFNAMVQQCQLDEEKRQTIQMTSLKSEHEQKLKALHSDNERRLSDMQLSHEQEKAALQSCFNSKTRELMKNMQDKIAQHQKQLRERDLTHDSMITEMKTLAARERESQERKEELANQAMSQKLSEAQEEISTLKAYKDTTEPKLIKASNLFEEYRDTVRRQVGSGLSGAAMIELIQTIYGELHYVKEEEEKK